MTKRDYILQWAAEETDITSWPDHPKVMGYCKLFYGHRYAPKGVPSFTREVRKLVAEGIFDKSNRVGLGFDAMVNFGNRTQTFWRFRTDTTEGSGS